MRLHLLPEEFSHNRGMVALAESVLISFIFITALYFFNRDIAIHLDSYHDLSLLVLAVITLYNGTIFGIVSLAVMAVGIYFFTLEYDLKTLLSYLIFVLLFGEFHFHFKRQRVSDREEKHYLKAKFRELSNAFFALKVSHDQLEKGYLLKPVTLRSLIIDLSANMQRDDIYRHLFETFQEAFSLQAACYCRLEEEKRVHETIPLGESSFTFDPEMEMVAQCIETKKPVFLAENKMEMIEKEPILAVLPVLDIHNRLLGLYIIEKMDFLEFNMDNILKIQILLEYLAQERFYHQRASHTSSLMNIAQIDARFQFEIDRLHTMYRRFGVHSAVVLLQTTNPAVSLIMENFKTSKMRLLDMVTTYQEKGAYFFIFLLPLERVSGAVSFRQRLERELEGFTAKEYRILVTEIEKIETIQQWIKRYEKTH